METSPRKRVLLDLEVLDIVGRHFFTLFIVLSFLGVFYLWKISTLLEAFRIEKKFSVLYP